MKLALFNGAIQEGFVAATNARGGSRIRDKSNQPNLSSYQP